jgi:hypothetical protein
MDYFLFFYFQKSLQKNNPNGFEKIKIPMRTFENQKIKIYQLSSVLID